MQDQSSGADIRLDMTSTSQIPNTGTLRDTRKQPEFILGACPPPNSASCLFSDYGQYVSQAMGYTTCSDVL